MNRKSALMLVLLAVLAVLVVLFFRTSGRERIMKAEAGTPSAGAAPAAADKPTKTVTLFFLREDDGRLAAEERQIATDASLVREAEEVLAELIKGPRGELVATIPAETKLGRIFLTKDGTAYVDFSRDLVDNHPSGTTAEISTIYAIVDSLTYNFKSIKKVFILIDGEERETLNGHLGLDRSFLPDYSLVAKR
jgi:spore germination protein GerM